MSNLYAVLYLEHDASLSVWDSDTNTFRIYEAERIANIKHFMPRRHTKLIDDVLYKILNMIQKDFGVKRFQEFIIKGNFADVTSDFLENHCSKSYDYIKEHSDLVLFPDISEAHHHSGHAWAGYIQSPYTNAFVITYDVKGDDSSITCRSIQDDVESTIKKYNQSIGLIYNIVGRMCYTLRHTNNILDIAGKLMGLAGYGQPTQRTHLLTETFRDAEQQHISDDTMGWFTEILMAMETIHGAHPEGFLDTGPSWDEVKSDNKLKIHNLRKVRGHAYNEFDSDTRYNRFFLKDQEETEWAYAAQLYIEQRLLDLVKDNLSDIRAADNNLILSGGCALNVLANERVKKEYPEISVYVPPNPHDGGISLGLLAERLVKQNLLKSQSVSGLQYAGADMLDNFYRVFTDYSETTPGEVAEQLRAGKIIGVIQGRSEVGPRALGNRSILCNAELANMKDILNSKVKHREWYRPFAPVCRLSDADQWFSSSSLNGYETMSFVADVITDDIPAVTHVDGTARLQTVTEESHKVLWDILTEFGGVLLNTSFNDNGKPILNDFATAKRILDNTELDAVLWIDSDGIYRITV